METKKKKYRLFDAILATVCIILVAESVAPAASIGNSQFFWWIILLIAFFLPYGLISAELGSTYPSEGGMYDWVKRAFGKRWAARVAWYYWINFPLWIASLAVLCTDIIAQMFGVTFDIYTLLGIQLLYILIVTIGSCYRVGESKWLVNVGALFKVLFMCALGLLGIYIAVKHGVANEYTVSSLFPSLDTAGIGFISVIIFNFMGFEVISTFSNDMKNPTREIPRAVTIGGILIAIFYLLPAFGVSVAVPISEISTSNGILDSFSILLNKLGWSASLIDFSIIIVGGMFVYTMIANIISWAFGVDSIARYSANDGSLPKAFGICNKKGVPYMAAIINGLVAAVIVILAVFIPSKDVDIFWTFFSFSLVTLLMSYIPLFPAFLKLRKKDPNITRPYMVKGGKFKLFLMAYVPLVLLIAGTFFTLFPEFNMAMFDYQWPLLAGVGVAIIIGEISAFSKKTEGK